MDDDHISKEHSLGRAISIGAIGLLILLVIGFAIVLYRKHRETASLDEQSSSDAGALPGVDVVNVAPAPASQSIQYPGDTRGWYQTTIYGRVNGYVGAWTKDIGDKVKKGEVLATIETPDLDAQLDAARQQLSISQSQVDVTQANTDFAKSTYERWRDSPKGSVSQQEIEQKKADFNGGIAQLKAAQAKVSADQSDVTRLTALESYKQVTAPFDGVVTARHIDIGDLVTAGSTSNTTPLYAVAQISRIRVFVDVPERVIGVMDDGVSAVATADEYPGKTFNGEIARTSRAIDPSSRTLHVEVDIDNPDGSLVPGMYLQVLFKIPYTSLLQVPASALIFTAQGPQVAVVNDQKRVEFHDVHIAIDNGDNVEIDSGVEADRKVALNLSNQITQGDQVEPTLVDSPGQPAKPAVASR